MKKDARENEMERATAQMHRALLKYVGVDAEQLELAKKKIATLSFREKIELLFSAH
jgi:hypothetical protein